VYGTEIEYTGIVVDPTLIAEVVLDMVIATEHEVEPEVQGGAKTLEDLRR
jgi:hypothetical protein